jgi:Fe-S-cluster-containing dehydrogenase component/DMSO reductase anchor subunit
MTSGVVRLPILSDAPAAPRGLAGLEQYLREQQRLSAVERFAARHDEGRADGERYHEDLIPVEAPGGGRQYAFRVDLDACTACKACVTACHSLNGLDEGETWRSVGLLHGGSPAAPVQQPVTTACHHCVEPACLKGCPVLAYEKDAVTGIVKHLDDQCIGCQYCTFTCPYEVPQYNARLGIVRKCDMCSGRLAAGEAPACVQACPNEAISITLVDPHQVVEDAQGDAFLPGAPSPGITLPTTRYESTRTRPANLLPADFYVATPSHQHTPLTVMLVLTQLSVGAFAASALASRYLPPDLVLSLRPLATVVATAFGLAALGASVFHLGRPLYAFRALLGLRTSWMSREILAFAIFAKLAVAAAVVPWLGAAAGFRAATDAIEVACAAAGLAGVACSVLVYHVTRRPWWSLESTGFKFLMTTVVLGLCTTRVTFSAGVAGLHDAAASLAVAPVLQAAARLGALAVLVKLAGELASLRHLRERRLTALKRSALLMTGDLRGYTTARFAFGVAGAAALLLSASSAVSPAWAAVALALLVVGEILERTLFFAAASWPSMPGGLR